MILEPARQIPVLDEVDVLVAGAGVSGCAAAVAAARAGARTMLLERNGTLGGVATAGLMANIGNLFLDRDGTQVIHGVAAEVIRRLVARGAASERWASREVPGVVLDSEQLKVVLIEMLEEAGVRVLTHTLAARPIVAGQRVRGAYLESKMGREAVLADVVVDTTGEADLAWQAGAAMRWSGGSASLEFKMARVDLDALYQHFRAHPETFPVGRDMVKGFAEFERNWVERGIFFFPHGGGFAWDIFQRAIAQGAFSPEQGVLHRMDACGLYGLRGRDSVIVNSNFWRVETLRTASVSEAELAAHQACYYVADFMRRSVPGFADGYIVQMATDLGIRTSRGIVGLETLRQEDAHASQPYRVDSTIGCAPAQADVAETGAFFYPHHHDIPYGALVPRNLDGLLVGSGKSVSCEPQSTIRGMALCMTLGHAAGAAAATCASQGASPREVPVRDVQQALLAQGAYLGNGERLARLGLSS